MFKAMYLVVLALLAVSLGACSSAPTSHVELATEVMVAHAADESSAYEWLVDAARKRCFQDGKSFNLISQSSTFDGIDEKRGQLADNVSWSRQAGEPGHREKDYRVEINFQCV